MILGTGGDADLFRTPVLGGYFDFATHKCKDEVNIQNLNEVVALAREE